MDSIQNNDTCDSSSVFTYTPDLSRPLCPKCGISVQCYTDIPTIPWIGTCLSGHTSTFQLDLDECEWLEDSSSGRFSRVATEHENSTWICNECGNPDGDPFDTDCNECGSEPAIR